MTKRSVLLLMMLLPLRVALADSDPNLTQLQQQLAAQQKILAEMQAKLAAMEAKQAAAPTEPNTGKLESKVVALQEAQAQQARQQQAMSQKLDYVAVKDANLPKSMEWVKNVKLGGDLRYRYENINDERNHGDYTRNRIRARIGLDAKVNDDVDASFRLATDQGGSSSSTGGDPTSTNQTLANGFSKKDVWLDLAYFNWHPKDIAGLNVLGGKMENPFYRVGSNQLIWDSDLTPEGMAVKYTKSITENDDLFFNGGGFWVNQINESTTVNALYQSLFGAQGGLKHTFEDKSSLLGGVGGFAYGNTQGKTTVWNPKSGLGNTVTTNAAGNTFYVNEYRLMELFAEYNFNLGKTPAAVYYDYVKNTQSTSSGDLGWLVGTSYGKCKDPGSWQLSYDYRELQSDAVLGGFSDSDFIGGGTNGKGHRFGATYQLTRNVQAGVNYFMDKAGDAKTDYDRFQADVVFKF